MTLKKHTKTVEVGGRTLTFESGAVARQANGAVWVKVDETMVLATACAAAQPKPDVSFFPLTINHQEKFSSAGKTLAGYIKREGRPTEHETLTCRLTDRPLRPLFPKGFRNETQVCTYVYSYDGVNVPDVLAICAASAALTISDIPLTKPVGAVRVGLIDGTFVINPTKEEMDKSNLDLVLAGTDDAILMIEGFCDFLTEEQVLDAIETGHKAIQTICKALNEWRQEIGKPKMETTLLLPPEGLAEEVASLAGQRVRTALRSEMSKAEHEAELKEIHDEVVASLNPEGEEPRFAGGDIATAYKSLKASLMREMVLEEGVRTDGRKTDEIRPIWIETSALPRTHGSAIFTRGETQSIAVCTLGGENMGQRFETVDGDGTRRFYLQYFFPPFSVGEVGRMGAASRREVGHGKLAERALHISLPPKEEFPYVVRLESNITESNGSSSMASVCGGCLAMMDAGVPVQRPVSGIAMGLILEGDNYTVLSDILGVEDALGDMDFKITGDGEGITAFQMDIKVEGITHDIMKAALMQAKQGRIHILEKMLTACPEPKKEMSVHAPRIETMQVAQSKIGAVIGPGGKMIRKIVEETGAEINIDDEGVVSIAGSAEGAAQARAFIENLVAEIEVGRTYDGKVVSVVPFGCFVEVIPGKEGLCHISELDHTHIKDITGYIKEGDPIQVKVLDINERGQVRLSRKAILKKEDADAPTPAA